MFIFWVCALH